MSAHFLEIQYKSQKSAPNFLSHTDIPLHANQI